MFCWLNILGADGLFAAFPTRAATYIPLALLGVVLAFLLIKAVRLWHEIHEVNEPITSDDLLGAFVQAHAEGELDDDEFDRVREQLAISPTDARALPTLSRPPHDVAAHQHPGPSTGEFDERSDSVAG